jgi:hypothetical protein
VERGPIGPPQRAPHAVDLGIGKEGIGQVAIAGAIVLSGSLGWWCLWMPGPTLGSRSIDAWRKELP